MLIRETGKRESPLISVKVNPNTIASIIRFDLK